MPAMTDVTESSYYPDDKTLPAEVSKPQHNPWISQEAQEAAIPLPVPDSSVSFDDIAPLDSLDPSHSVHYSSPVPSSFMEPDQSTTVQLTDITDANAKPGVAGLRNIGNTCFMNAGLQCLLSNPKLAKFFLEQCDLDPDMKGTLTGRFSELVIKVWSGQYSQIHPLEFKETLGTYYPQFRDFRQHDCQEFLALLLDSFHEQLNTSKAILNKLASVDDVEEECSTTLPEPPPPDDRHLEVPPPEDNQSDAQSEVSSVQSAHVVSSDRQSVASSPVDLEVIQSQAVHNDIDRASTQSNCLSEDSNLSEVSQQSLEADSSHRMMSIPECIKSRTTQSAQELEQDMEVDSAGKESEDVSKVKKSEIVDADSTSEAQGLLESSDNNDLEPLSESGAKRFPSIEDFYMKDTKTLNTNVLASDFIEEAVSTDSEKFHKPDNVNRPTDPYETLTDFLMSEVKGPPIKPVKETNLLANVKDKFSDDLYSKKSLFSQLEEEDEAKYSINNIKRMKIDEDEKNIRMQARLKVNTNKNPTKERDSKPVDPCCSSSDVRPGGSGIPTFNSPSMCYPDNRHQMEADRAWRKYLEKNQSVVVDTFQGQFRSTVVCSECYHVSVTYEPFMYLSVPLPHAMERQMCVTFVPCDSKQPVKYLVTLNKQDSIKKLKAELQRLIEEESADIIVAEVLDNHIARILEDNTLLRFINDANRSIYAFEMMPPPQVEERPGDIAMATDNGVTTTTPITTASSTVVAPNNEPMKAEANNSAVREGKDIFSSMGVFSGVDSSSSTLLESVQNNQKSQASVENKDLELSQILNNLGDSTNTGAWLQGTGYNSSVDWQDNLLNDMDSSAPADMGTGLWGSHSDDLITHAGDVDSQSWDKLTETEEVSQSDKDTAEGTGVGTTTDDGGPVTDSWKSCAICLEEMADAELMIHTSCGGTLCQACLEMSFKHYGDSALMCPVCSTPVDPADDFIQLSAMADYKPKTRILSVPIVQRYEYEENGEQKMRLFGHPNILYLPSQMSGDFLFESVDRVVSCLAPYSILLTDGQGYHCSRCMYTTHCRGCELVREGDITLQPGDHLAIRFHNISNDQLDFSKRYTHHKSMEKLRPNQPLTLLDCFNAFTDSEVLDEHNPWYCPRCRKNQCALKTITVWQYPETLVVYLKRFVFHELSSTKIDNKVVFPLENLDLSDYISGPRRDNLNYDLQSCVCHFGGVNAGHYTAYAKHSLASEWYYYNDETFSGQQPQEADYSNAYILFYRKQGTGASFVLPETSQDEEGACDSASTKLQGPLNNEDTCHLLQHMEDQSPLGGSTSLQQPDSTLDFYS